MSLARRTGLLLAIATVLGLGVFWLFGRLSAGHTYRTYHDSPARDLEPVAGESPEGEGAAVVESPVDGDLQQGGGIVEGVVMCEGSPVEGAALHAAPPNAYAQTSDEVLELCTPARSDAQGSFSLAVKAPGSFVIVCRKNGLRAAVVSFADLPRAGVTIQMQGGVTATGRVVDEGGNPIPDAAVYARAYSVTHEVAAGDELLWPGAEAAPSAVTTSDARGHFTVAGLDPAMAYVVEAFAAGYAMARSSLASPKLHLQPPGDVGDIVLMRVYVVIFGVRRSDVDYTPSLWTALLAGQLVLRPPDGFSPAFPRVPRDTFPAAIAKRLTVLQDRGGVFFFRPRAGQEPQSGSSALSVRILENGAELSRFEVPLRPIGATGWDTRPWYELPADGRPAPGRVVVTSTGWAGPFSLQSDAGYFVTAGGEGGGQVATVPVGSYVVRRWGAEGYGGERWAVEVASGKTVELSIPPVGATLTIRPRFESGTTARDVGIRIESCGDIVFRELEPYGCAEGPVQIPIGGAMRGEVHIVLTKLGYEPCQATVSLGAEDVLWQPTLTPIPLDR